MSDSDPRATFGYAIQALNEFNLAYLHLIEPSEADLRHGGMAIPTTEFRPAYRGKLTANWDYDRESGNAAIASGEADLVSYGKLLIANPDLTQALPAQCSPQRACPRHFLRWRRTRLHRLSFPTTQNGFVE
jgi:N-ethylmaleimide reductase